MVIFGCTDVICKPYCSDVVEHYVRPRCYHACFDCTDVICNLIAQMLLSIVSGTDVLMPVSYYLFLAQMLMYLICGQDVIRPIFYYFIFSSGMLNSKLSQMCGRLYFPIFLLSAGLFTLIYIDSFLEILRQNIFPDRPEEAAMFGCKSLST